MCLLFGTSCQIDGKSPERIWLTKFHARIYDVLPNASRQGFNSVGCNECLCRVQPMIQTRWQCSIEHVQRFTEQSPTFNALDDASRQSIRQKLARALIRAYENGERDPELLAIIAVQSYLRDG